jgi:hypothetical protein
MKGVFSLYISHQNLHQEIQWHFLSNILVLQNYGIINDREIMLFLKVSEMKFVQYGNVMAQSSHRETTKYYVNQGLNPILTTAKYR